MQLGADAGGGADLKGLLERVQRQYERAMHEPVQLGARLADLLLALEGAGWLVFTDSELNTQQRLLSQGQSQPDHLGQRVSGPYRGR